MKEFLAIILDTFRLLFAILWVVYIVYLLYLYVVLLLKPIAYDGNFE